VLFTWLGNEINAPKPVHSSQYAPVALWSWGLTTMTGCDKSPHDLPDHFSRHPRHLQIEGHDIGGNRQAF